MIFACFFGIIFLLFFINYKTARCAFAASANAVKQKEILKKF